MWTNNKYYLNDVQSNLKNTADLKVMPSASKEVLQQEAAALRDAAAASSLLRL